MTYYEEIVLGPAKAGLVLTASFFDMDGTPRAGITYTIDEISGGNYYLRVTSAPDDFVGYGNITCSTDASIDVVTRPIQASSDYTDIIGGNPYELRTSVSYKDNNLTVDLWFERFGVIITSDLTLNQVQILKASDHSVATTVAGASFTTSDNHWVATFALALERSTAYILKVNVSETGGSTWDAYSSFGRL